MKIIFQTMRRMLEFFFLLLFSILVFSLISFSLFNGSKENDPYFTSFGETFLNIFILQTTANYPDVTIPKVREQPLYSLFFVVYLVVQLYFIVNVNIATVFNTYKAMLHQKNIKQFVRTRITLIYAFCVLSRDGTTVDVQSWVDVYAKLHPFTPSDVAVAKVANVCDNPKNSTLNMEEFVAICEDKTPMESKTSRLVRMRNSVKKIKIAFLQKIVEHKYGTIVQ